jgi:hypothetical protein
MSDRFRPPPRESPASAGRQSPTLSLSGKSLRLRGRPFGEGDGEPQLFEALDEMMLDLPVNDTRPRLCAFAHRPRYTRLAATFMVLGAPAAHEDCEEARRADESRRIGTSAVASERRGRGAFVSSPGRLPRLRRLCSDSSLGRSSRGGAIVTIGNGAGVTSAKTMTSSDIETELLKKWRRPSRANKQPRTHVTST